MLGNITAFGLGSLILGLPFWGTTPGNNSGKAQATVDLDLRQLLTDTARQWSDNTTVLFPDSPDFAKATERWTVFRPPTYRAAIRPGTPEDIGKIVKLAASYKIPFLTRGAGHSYSITLAEFQHGLALDLSHFKTIEIDIDSETLTVGPGVTFNDIFDPLYQAGFQLQTGTCSCPSLIGVTLGGGVGRLQGKHGLVLDALLSVRMVTADGEHIEVSRNSHPDLFWGIRGAGANFGVVTSATYKVHRLINRGEYLHADFYFPAEKSYEYFKIIESLNENLPADLATIVLVNWNSTTNQIQVGGNWVYFGPKDEGMKLLKPVFDLQPISSVVSTVSWNKLLATTGGNYDDLVCLGSTMRDLYSLNQKKYSASGYQKGFDKMARFFADHPGGRNSALVFEIFPNQATAAVPQDETAYAWRDATGYIIAHLVWDHGDTATADAANKLGLDIRKELTHTSGYSKPSVFLNYARGDEGLENIYGLEKLPRLVQLKKAWDPNNLFAFNLPLPTEYSQEKEL
ncbi:hypothetical protein L249_1067 [Ophiocordyceps polyrhachis-furcata BCC 54312]|uniref:FAD-binding PCMH-type domain-containing protein n=1 Tax=Ophiocordyceps polyrhachis-furcata BCC 54312 TaxID=1330021 RepID=A0A367LE88_9HYPO|nr:hypothetical protein L249_1067 [Ophiocordyceps polyrhachis-furcata BCC 54312]